MSFGRIALAWVGVTLWLVVVGMATRRWAMGEGDVIGARGPRVLTLIDAALITLFGALWFASLGSGAWWLVFGVLGLLVGVERTVESRMTADSWHRIILSTVRYLGSGLILSLLL